MSEQHMPRPSRTHTLNAEAAQWLARANAGTWSSEDQAELDAWLAAARANRVAYWRLEAAWLEAGRLQALGRSKPEAPERRVSTPLKVAAAIAIMAALGFAGARSIMQPRVKTYATALGGHETLKLEDGTRIELNTNTAVRLAMVNGTRKVWLDRGEAYFQVRHDAAHPFVVIAGGHTITDLGTRFDIRTDPQDVEVALLEGRARFDNGTKKGPLHSVALTPGDVVMASADSVSVTRRPIRELTNALAWRQGLLIFNYTTLADAAAEFNRYNARKIVVSDPEAARLTIIGKFPAEDAELFGRVVKRILGVRVEDRDGQIVISR